MLPQGQARATMGYLVYKDSSQLFTIHFPNDIFQINRFNEHAINSNKSTSKLHNVYILLRTNSSIFQSSSHICDVGQVNFDGKLLPES